VQNSFFISYLVFCNMVLISPPLSSHLPGFSVTTIDWINCHSPRRGEHGRIIIMILKCLAHCPAVFQTRAYFLSYILKNKVGSPYLQACFCTHFHFSHLNHPYKFKEITVNIASSYPNPGYFVHLVYCLTICPSLLEDFQ
jgi:hypothetical protein